MASSLTPGCASLGLDALAHMSFLARTPERALALRLALSRVIRPTSVVLDAGCGSLGVLAILAAKLGASRVIGVDFGAFDQAQALAEENGVADKVQFMSGDLHSVDLPIQSFDVIVSMIYNNNPQRDLAQQRLIASLVARFGHADTVIIPNKVRYTVAGCRAGVQDRSHWTRRVEWETRIENVERQTGMTFAAVRHLLDQAGAMDLTTGRPPWTLARLWRDGMRRVWGVVRALLGHVDRSQRTLLTPRQVFAEIDYTARMKELDYPPSASLPVRQRGQLNLVVFQQDLLFDDLLIRTTESPSMVDPPQPVELGDVAILSTGGQWGRCIPCVVERNPARSRS
jgi:trans-aconitate methyltransferase